MVFKTIAENIKSFFEKEEALEKEPKKAPDAAVELYEKPIGKEHEIVKHHLQGSKINNSSSGLSSRGSSSNDSSSATPHSSLSASKLPFSSQELREHLKSSTLSNSDSPLSHSLRPPSPSSSSSLSRSSKSSREDDLSSQIAQFEQVVGSISPVDEGVVGEAFVSEESLKKGVSDSSNSLGSANSGSSGISSREGYFSRLARELASRGYEADVIDGALERMKKHHVEQAVLSKRQQELALLEREVSRTLAELQGLEREWAAKREEAEAARERMGVLENLVVEKSNELKKVVEELKQRAKVLEGLEAEQLKIGGSLTSSKAASSDDSKNAPLYPLGRAPRAPESNNLVNGNISASSPALTDNSSSYPSSSEKTSGSLHPFHLADGRSLNSLSELRSALLSMDDSLFYRHVSADRNDFATWIRDVFKDQDLAARFEAAPNRFVAASLLNR